MPPVPQPASAIARATPPAAANSGRTLCRRLVSRLELGDGLVAGGIDREDAVEARDLKDLGDVAVTADERELSVVRAQSLDAADEHTERRRIDERRVAEVDDDLLAALPDHLEQLLFELGRRVQVDLAGERDHVGIVSQLFCLDVEVHLPPVVAPDRLFPSARSLTPGLRALAQRLDPVPDLRLRRRVEVEREQTLVRIDGDLRLVQRLTSLGEQEERLLVLRLELDDLLVRGDCLRRSGLVLRRGGLELSVRLVRGSRGNRVLSERLAELSRRRPERGSYAGLRLGERGELSLLEVEIGLGQLEIAETTESGHVLRPEPPVREPGGDGLVRAALVLQDLGESTPGRRVERPLAHRLLGLRQRARRGTLVAECVAQQLSEVEPAGANTEKDEPAREHEDQNDERPLRLVAQAGEEHRVIGYASGAATTGSAAGGTASMARLALCAAAVSSCQSIPPFS